MVQRIEAAAHKRIIKSAYRQQALACAASLSKGPRRTSEVKTIVPDAPRILLHNVYGGFCRVGARGLCTHFRGNRPSFPLAAGSHGASELTIS